ncbi:MAG: M48 family metalloprotease [Hyphomicrobiales bacterium]|nr:M48 family metalloprotease [Hyphomicrobiales bacterium]
MTVVTMYTPDAPGPARPEKWFRIMSYAGQTMAFAGRLNRWRGLAATCILSLTIAGCASVGGPFDLPSDRPSVPPGAPRVIGAKSRLPPQSQKLVTLFGGQYESPKAERAINAILRQLAAASDNPAQVYKVTILNSPAVNAFALPSGDLFVTRGLLALANDSAELAAVMAHEIAHVTLSHAHQRAEAAKTEALRIKVANNIQSRSKGDEVKAIGRLNLASFSRQQELEADAIGVQVVSRAGFDPYGASRFLRSLGRSVAMRSALLGGRNTDEQPDIMASHPSTPARISRAILAARQIGAPGIGSTGREAYLEAIEGIDFGDDPAEGFVRRRRFIHAKLGFSFTAPPGFVLENSAQALVGVASRGSQALRLDSVQVDAGKPLTEYMATGWIEGLEPATIKPATINGLPAALASATHNGWRFRVGVIRLGTDVYRLIFAARSLPAATEQRINASIRSFRRIPVAEARRLRALRIALVAAKPGDTPASMARSMAVSERALDVFLLINGLRRGDRLQSGRKYKTIIE